MPRGKVKWFNNAKGYGFIIEEGETEDLFAHFSSIQIEGYKTLKAGQTVTFEKQPSSKGTHAVNICPVPEETTKQTSPDSEPKQAELETPDNIYELESKKAVGA
ncbi:MAG: cold-shock protein [Gammaproteobacteria bacterium]|nr:MAG: cold-shock protein [Gammaproteobacteria bacterium]